MVQAIIMNGNGGGRRRGRYNKQAIIISIISSETNGTGNHSKQELWREAEGKA